jgi:carboxylesterase type B
MLSCQPSPPSLTTSQEKDGTGNIQKVTWKLRVNVSGAAHADELGYLFHMLLTSRIVLEPDDPAVVTQSRMVKLWTNFAKTG